MRRTPVYGIDLIRFLAASSVVVWHFAGKPFLTPTASTLHPLLPLADPSAPPGAAFSWWGWVGVQVFFVISGAVIAYSVKSASAKSFLVARVARLWPTMVICATICSVLSILFWHTALLTEIVRFADSIVFSPLGPWYSGQIWTLPIEIVFYATVWGFIACERAHWLEGLAWSLACVSAVYWLEAVIKGHPFGDARFLQLFLVLHGGYFALGMVIAKIATDGVTPARLLLGGITLATGVIQIHFRVPEEVGNAPYAHPALVPCLVWLGAVVAIFAAMEWRDVIATRLHGMKGTLRTMGLITYPLYLVHYQTGAPVFANLYRLGLPLWGAFAVSYAFVLGCALVIAVWLEPILHRVVKAKMEAMLNVREPMVRSI